MRIGAFGPRHPIRARTQPIEHVGSTRVARHGSPLHRYRLNLVISATIVEPDEFESIDSTPVRGRTREIRWQCTPRRRVGGDGANMLRGLVQRDDRIDPMATGRVGNVSRYAIRCQHSHHREGDDQFQQRKAAGWRPLHTRAARKRAETSRRSQHARVACAPCSALDSHGLNLRGHRIGSRHHVLPASASVTMRRQALRSRPSRPSPPSRASRFSSRTIMSWTRACTASLTPNPRDVIQ